VRGVDRYDCSMDRVAFGACLASSQVVNMVYPIAGILSRWTVLGWLVSAAIASWIAAPHLSAADKEEKEALSPRALHYVIPKEGKKLSTSLLRKLDIVGGLAPGWEGRLQFARTPGYWAWVDDEGADKIRIDDSVETVEKFNSGDIQEIGTQTTAPTQRLMVHLAPNAWTGKVKRSSFLSAADLARQWAKNTGDSKVMFRPVRIDAVMVLSHGPMPPLALAAIKESPQVVTLEWAGGKQVPQQPVPQQGGVNPGQQGQGFVR